MRVETLSEAIQLINKNAYGNGCVFTGDGNTARIFEEVWAGMIGINVPLPVPAATQSFGVEGLTVWRSSHLWARWGEVFAQGEKLLLKNGLEKVIRRKAVFYAI